MIASQTRLFAFLFASAVAASPALAQVEVIKKDVPFVPTPQQVVDEMLRLADVKETDRVYDLGCGDGRMIVTAAQRYGANGIGIDIDPQRIKESNENAKAAGVTDKVKFIIQDLFDTDFRDATVLTMYLLPEVNLRLRPTILNDLKPGTRIVSHAFDMDDWEPEQTVSVEPDGETVYFWIVPAKVGGTWNATIESADGRQKQQVKLNLKQEFQKVSGAAEIDGKQHEISDGKLRGTQLTFGLPTGTNGSVVRYSCRVDGSRIDGFAQKPAAAGSPAVGNGSGSAEPRPEARLAATRAGADQPQKNRPANDTPTP